MLDDVTVDSFVEVPDVLCSPALSAEAAHTVGPTSETATFAERQPSATASSVEQRQLEELQTEHAAALTTAQEESGLQEREVVQREVAAVQELTLTTLAEKQTAGEAALQRHLEKPRAGGQSLSQRLRLLQQERQTLQQERTLQRQLHAEEQAVQSQLQTEDGTVPEASSNVPSAQSMLAAVVAATPSESENAARVDSQALINPHGSRLVCPHAPGSRLWRVWVHDSHKVLFRRYAGPDAPLLPPNPVRQSCSGVAEEGVPLDPEHQPGTKPEQWLALKPQLEIELEPELEPEPKE